MLKFRQIPMAGRVLIIVVAIGVFAIALVSCATSYNAIYRLVAQLGLYGQFTTQGFPLLVDAAFLVTELAAILGWIMRAVTRSDEVSYGWPGFTMLLCGACTIAFNIAHAYLIGGRHDPLTVWRCLVAALPPVLMILSFQVLIVIVKWTMLHLGRSAGASLLAPAGTGGFLGVPASHPQMEQRWWERSEIGHTDQRGSAAGGGVGSRDGRVRAAVEATLERLGSEQAKALGPGGVAAETTTLTGVDVTERYVRQIMSGAIGTPRGGGAGGNGVHP